MTEPSLTDFAICEKIGISQQALNEMYEEDVLRWAWIIRRKERMSKG